MTALAAPAERSPVGIVGAVAGVTGPGERDPAGNLSAMAGEAVEPGVSPGEREPRIAIVIELPERPAVRVVATGTIAAQPALVAVVCTVTRYAVHGRVAKTPRCMALATGHHAMQADQRKTGDVVIERDRLAPAGRLVAVLATLAELALVGIVSAMARDASRRQLVLS